MKLKKFAATALVAIGLTFGSGVAASPANAATAAVPVDCWTDISTNQSMCVPVGTGIYAAALKKFGVDTVQPNSAGQMKSLATGRTLGSSVIVSPQITQPILKLYIDANYATGGGVWTFTSATTNCQILIDDYGSESPGTGYYNNRVSSFHTYLGCRTWLFDNAFFGGDEWGPEQNAATLGTFNDRANSSQTM